VLLTADRVRRCGGEEVAELHGAQDAHSRVRSRQCRGKFSRRPWSGRCLCRWCSVADSIDEVSHALVLMIHRPAGDRPAAVACFAGPAAVVASAGPAPNFPRVCRSRSNTPSTVTGRRRATGCRPPHEMDDFEDLRGQTAHGWVRSRHRYAAVGHPDRTHRAHRSPISDVGVATMARPERIIVISRFDDARRYQTGACKTAGAAVSSRSTSDPTTKAPVVAPTRGSSAAWTSGQGIPRSNRQLLLEAIGPIIRRWREPAKSVRLRRAGYSGREERRCRTWPGI
jgi:hypothetical protein